MSTAHATRRRSAERLDRHEAFVFLNDAFEPKRVMVRENSEVRWRSADVLVLAGLLFRDVLTLQDQRQRLFRARRVFREGQRLIVSGEAVEVVVPAVLGRRATLGMTPDAILEYFIDSISRLASSRHVREM